MYTDHDGKTLLKLNFHTHTRLSDGHRTPEEAAAIYRANGYDAIALTDHWKYGEETVLSDLPILPGCEYDIGSDPAKGVFHIVGICCARQPSVDRSMTARQLIEAIHEAEGFAILAHPEWSLNTVEQIMGEDGATLADASEIYNSVSACGMSYRPESSAVLDRVAIAGRAFPLVAADDTHYYTDDACKSFVYVRADEPSREAVLAALKKGDFFASQGPILSVRVEGNQVHLRTTPVKCIRFHTSFCWHPDTVRIGENLTEATFTLAAKPYFWRISVEDAQGRCAWTSYLPISD